MRKQMRRPPRRTPVIPVKSNDDPLPLTLPPGSDFLEHALRPVPPGSRIAWPHPCMHQIEPLLPKPTSYKMMMLRQEKAMFLLLVCRDVFPHQPRFIRRVYLDLGARDYASSVGWFREHYPEGRTFEIHAFEVDPKYRAMGYDKDEKCTFHNAAAWMSYGCIAMASMDNFAGAAYGTTFLPSNKTDVVPFSECERLIPKTKNMIGPIPTVDIAAFMSKTLGLTPSNSFVVLKVDVEGPEWVLMNHLRESGGLRLVKETMIECHWDWHKGPFKGIPLSECHRQQRRLREDGVYAHEWY